MHQRRTSVAQSRRLPILGLLIAIALIAAGLGVLSLARATPSHALSESGVLSAAPRVTTQFLAAYARGDEATADSLASPLYRAEWERRGLSAKVRTLIAWPEHRTGEPLEERLRFTFFGGIVDEIGFGHLLFVVRPTLPGRPLAPSVFRVDVDPAGRVIWLELVWHFAEDVEAVRPVQDSAELTRVPLPSAPCCARLLFGVSSIDGREGYYAFTVERESPTASALPRSPRPAVVRFFAVDSDRQIRPGAWDFSQGGEGLPEYGEPRRERREPRLEAEDASRWHSYLATLD